MVRPYFAAVALVTTNTFVSMAVDGVSTVTTTAAEKRRIQEC